METKLPTRVTSVVWDAGTGTWTVTAADGRQWVARFVVAERQRLLVEVDPGAEGEPYFLFEDRPYALLASPRPPEPPPPPPEDSMAIAHARGELS